MSIAPRKILFVHSSNEMYGADVILLELIRACDRSQWTPAVIVPCDVPYEGRFTRELERIQVDSRAMKLAVLRRRYFSPAGFPRYLAYFARSTLALAHIIRREGFDVVHSNTTAVLPGAFAARLTKRPHIWHSHEMIVSPRSVRLLTARLAPRMSRVVLTVSDAVKQHMLQDNPAARNIRVLHNGIDVERFANATGRSRIRSEFGYSESDVVVGTLARISRGKGQGYLARAAALLKDTQPDLKYLLVGDAFVGQEHLVDELRQTIAELGLEGRITLTGYRSDGPDVLAALDICVLPSTLPDSFPTVVLEGMAAGKPVIATDWGGAKEMVTEGETGYIVPTDDEQTLSQRLAELASSESLRTAMGEAGQRRAVQHFTKERMGQEFWMVVNEVATRNQKAS